jgi:hypothetical protein
MVNCASEMQRKSQKIYVVVAAAEMYLAIRDLTSEELTQCVDLPGRWHGAVADRFKVVFGDSVFLMIVGLVGRMF